MLLSLMDDDVLEIYRWNYDAVCQIFTYSQLHKPTNLYNIITLYLVSIIAIYWL